MPQLPFEPAPGLFTDTTSFSGNGGWIDGNNVRFWEGRWQVIGGWTQLNSLSISSGVDSMLEWSTTAGNTYLACGGPGALKVKLSTTLYDIRPGLEAGPWSFATFGDTLIANPTNSKIYQWSLNTAVAAAQVTNAPTQVTTILVTPWRQLLAFGCNEVVSGTFNARCIRCSDLEDITSWTPSSTNNSDEIILDGATSKIVAARMIGNFVAVWTSSELFLGVYVGDPSESYRFERVAGQCGLAALKAVTVVGSTAYWLTPDLKFKAWSPGAEPQTLACPIIDSFRTAFPTSSAKVALTFASYVGAFNEVWFTYQNNSGTIIGGFVAFSLTDGKWFKGNANRTVMHQGISGLYGATSTGGMLITCESGQKGLTTSGTDLSWSITSSAIYLDSGQRRFMLRSVRPDFQDYAGNIIVTVNMQQYPAAAYTGTKALTVTGTTTKKDFRLSGRLLTVAFSGDDAGGTTNTAARQGLPVFDLVPTGER